MAHSYHTQTYNLFSEEMGRRCEAEWVLFHNNESSPNSPVTIALYKIDGKELTFDDPRRTEVTLPFGLLAEFVGHRICCDRISSLEQMNPRQVLADMGLADQE